MASIHDIGFIAASREIQGRTEYGFKVFVGGGLGSHPKLAKLYTEFLPMEEVLPFCEAILEDLRCERRPENKEQGPDEIRSGESGGSISLIRE
ncbi:MAG: hypothetical protein MPW15_01070 [Candidatus Manganitrophus sp.]|nr:hypothetical protein [Candidatus Manganitrophus sp.]